MTPLSFLLAVLLDFMLGDPRWLPHPVRWMGSLIAGLERCLFPVRRAARKEFCMGSLLCVSVLIVCAGTCGLTLFFAQKVSIVAVIAVETILGFYCISARSLVEEAMKVHKMLKYQDMAEARAALSMIVGRDTESLMEKDIICATVETVAENITDGIVSPLFYLALGGPVVAVAFKAVSTMDSMIGHKNDRYRHFGTFAAWLDDMLNFIPARITGFILIPLASLLLRHDWKISMRITDRDRLKHESPNSAHGISNRGDSKMHNSQQMPRFFCSWSGGKDSCLSLYKSLKAGYSCASLFTMIDESGKHSRSHGLFPEALKAQAAAMGIPLRTASASWGNYEAQFKEQAALYNNENVLHGFFGDIDLEPHREWVERVCRESGLRAHFPLWKGNRRALVEKFIDAGFKAIIVVVNTKKMPDRFLGRLIDTALVNELEGIDVDACGENGEFHTFVYDGPLFKNQLRFTKGDVIANEGYAFLPITVSGNSATEVCS
jgi:adenosylcobinamide-phosphate synthase